MRLRHFLLLQPKPVLASGLILCLLSLVFGIWWMNRTEPPAAKIMIQSTGGDDDDLSLLLPLSELFANKDILSEAVKSLSSSGIKSENLGKRVRVSNDNRSEVIRIVVSHPDRKQAAQEANAIAEAGKVFYLNRAVKKKDSEIELLKKELESKQLLLNEVLEKKKLLEASSAVQETNDVTERELQNKEAQLASLLETYTDQHPNVVDLKKQINYLRQTLAQVSALPSPTGEVQIIQGQYDTAASAYQAIHDKISETIIARGKIRSPINMIAMATANPVSKPRAVPLVFPVVLPILALIGLVIYIYYRVVKQRAEDKKLDKGTA